MLLEYLLILHILLGHQQNYNMLLQARYTLLSVFASNMWNLTPTTHYMTIHAFEFLKIDQTAYFTLREGIEHRNKVDKKDFKNTMKELLLASNGKFCWQILIDE